MPCWSGCMSSRYQHNITTYNLLYRRMTRKSRPSRKAGYCEMCNTDYGDAALHRRSPHHLAFVRDHTNFIALDSLISSGADVTTFLDKATPVNGERRSLRKLCNGDVEKRKSKRSQSPDLNGSVSPKRNGLEDERKHNTRCSKKTSESQPSEDRQYYKVVGVSTKLRSSGGFAKQKDSSPNCNGTKPLVVKFRKVRRSELSVLSDEAEQFMFPKRASSTSSTSSDDDDDDDDKDDLLPLKKKTPPQPLPSIERQRLARPLALKEESSEEDSWPEDKRRRKRRAPAVAKRTRRVSNKAPVLEVPDKPPEPEPDPIPEEIEILPQRAETPQPEGEISPLREEPAEKCMKWEDGKLKYTPAVEQLEFAFESVPRSEPWFETFKRQDQHKVLAKNVPRYFALYSKSPKLPYEIGQLPPLKPNCCPLSDLVKREEKPGPSRSYGTRGMKKEKIKKRTAAILALESHPRKSPREHASTLAILGSAGLLQRRRINGDDAKSTASEDTISDTHSNLKIEPILSENQEASERLQQFFTEVFDEPADYDVCEDFIDGNTNIIVAKNVPDVSSLVSECEDCDIIRKEIDVGAISTPRGKRGKFKKKNKTGWPNKRKTKKISRGSSTETDLKTESLGRSSVEPPDDETTQSSISEEDQTLLEVEKDESTLIENIKSDNDSRNSTIEPTDIDSEGKDSEDQPLKFALRKSKLELKDKLAKEDKLLSHSSEDSQDKDIKVRRKKRAFDSVVGWGKNSEEQLLKETQSKSKTEVKDASEKEDKTSTEDSEDKEKVKKKKRATDGLGSWLSKTEVKDGSEKEDKTSSEDSEDKEKVKKKKKPTYGLGSWLQPIVRVSRVDPNVGRRLRSAGRVRTNRFR